MEEGSCVFVLKKEECDRLVAQWQSGVFVQVSLLRHVEGHCHVIVWGLANRQDSCDDQ